MFEEKKFLFGSKVSATQWTLVVKFAGKVGELCKVTPMRTAYHIDEGEWYFKTF